MPVVRADRARRRAQNYRFSSIVLGIVNSTPFLKKVRSEKLEVRSTESATPKF